MSKEIWRVETVRLILLWANSISTIKQGEKHISSIKFEKETKEWNAPIFSTFLKNSCPKSKMCLPHLQVSFWSTRIGQCSRLSFINRKIIRRLLLYVCRVMNHFLKIPLFLNLNAISKFFEERSLKNCEILKFFRFSTRILPIKQIKDRGFLFHFTSEKFFQRYSLLTPNTFLYKGSNSKGIDALFHLLKVPLHLYYFDETSCFIKNKTLVIPHLEILAWLSFWSLTFLKQYEFLEKTRKKKLKPITIKLQAVIRGFLVRRRNPRTALNKKKSVRLLEQIWLAKKLLNWTTAIFNGFFRPVAKKLPESGADLPTTTLEKLQLGFCIARSKLLCEVFEEKHSDLEVEIRQKILGLTMFSGNKPWKYGLS